MHPVIQQPCHPATLSSSNPVIQQPYHPATLSSSNPVIQQQRTCYPGTEQPCHPAKRPVTLHQDVHLSVDSLVHLVLIK
eukprot:1151273-Pelagomonas_calceolata.AAC.1